MPDLMHCWMPCVVASQDVKIECAVTDGWIRLQDFAWHVGSCAKRVKMVWYMLIPIGGLSSSLYWNTDCPQSEAGGDGVAVWRAVWLMEISCGDMWWSHGLFECSLEWQSSVVCSGVCEARACCFRAKGLPNWCGVKHIKDCGRAQGSLATLLVPLTCTTLYTPILQLLSQWCPPLLVLSYQHRCTTWVVWWHCWKHALVECWLPWQCSKK